MRVLICGSQTWDWEDPIALLIGGLDRYTDSVVQGGAPGADDLARLWALKHQVPVTTLPVASGRTTNREMLTEAAPDAVYAFIDRPLVRSLGTLSMIRTARASGIPCYVVRSG